MTPKQTRESREARSFRKAVAAVAAGATQRQAAHIARLPLSTFHDRLHRHHNPRPPVNRSHLKHEEENEIVATINKFSERAVPMNRDDVADAVQVVVQKMDASRAASMPFIGGRPGKKFLSAFLKRHSKAIRLGRPSSQEDIRWASTNATTLTSHFAQVEALIREHNIDASRLANLDECGVTAGRDASGRTQRKVYMTRATVAQQRTVDFKNVQRVTMMPVIFASGHVGNPLFVIRGTRVRYRVLSKDGKDYIESITDCLPRHSMITTREDLAGVDKHNFLRWAQAFVQEVKDLTTGGRKVLLIYDGYRSHMGLRVLETLDKGNVIAYALPSHTSGTTQPLDVSIFGPFKQHLSESVNRIFSPFRCVDYDIFDFLKLLHAAYLKAFTVLNVQSGFRRTGLWPFNPNVLLSQARPLSTSKPFEIATVDAIVSMLETKRAAIANGMGIRPQVQRHGFIDTSGGMTLTSADAMRLIRRKEAGEVAQSALKRRKQAEAVEKRTQIYERVRAERMLFEQRRLRYRVSVYGDPKLPPRPMKVRRTVAARRAAESRALIASRALLELHSEKGAAL